MVDFSNIKQKAAVSGETTREYTFDTIEGEPSVICAPAHDENPAFLDERLRLATERAAKLAEEPKPKTGRPEITPERIKQNMEEDRDYDRRILASTCIKSWGTAPVDVSGKAVEFSPENALAFLEALPNYVLDPFRQWAQNIFNFVKRPTTDAKRNAALGESPPTG